MRRLQEIFCHRLAALKENELIKSAILRARHKISALDKKSEVLYYVIKVQMRLVDKILKH